MVSLVLMILFALIAGVCALMLVFANRKKPGSQFRMAGTGITLAIACVAFLLAWLLPSFLTVGQGEVGVRFDPFGKYQYYEGSTLKTSSVSPEEYGEGLHMKAPWVTVDKFNVKTQDYTMSVIAEEGLAERDDRVRTVTSEGLYVGLDITVLYKLVPNQADVVRRTLGIEGDYQDIIVRPAIRSTIREVASEHTAAEIYGEGRITVQEAIFTKLESYLKPRGITVESILLRDVELPTEITNAINAKKKAEQEAMQMEYVLQKERLEKERKIIEAEGIKASQDIIQQELTPEYLSWYWISNLKNHNNVVYIIPGENGLPIFKDIDELSENSSKIYSVP